MKVRRSKPATGMVSSRTTFIKIISASQRIQRITHALHTRTPMRTDGIIADHLCSSAGSTVRSYKYVAGTGSVDIGEPPFAEVRLSWKTPGDNGGIGNASPAAGSAIWNLTDGDCCHELAPLAKP